MTMRMIHRFGREVLGRLARGTRAHAEGPDEPRQVGSGDPPRGRAPAACSEEPAAAATATRRVWRTATIVELDP